MNALGSACIDTGEVFKQLSEAKCVLEEEVKQNFLEPLVQLQNKELKEIAVSILILMLWSVKLLQSLGVQLTG